MVFFGGWGIGWGGSGLAGLFWWADAHPTWLVDRIELLVYAKAFVARGTPWEVSRPAKGCQVSPTTHPFLGLTGAACSFVL